MNKSSGISRNIPASRRWKILALAEELRLWTGSGTINARQAGLDTQMSYNGIAGYQSITAPHNEDFDLYLAAMNRIIMAHKELIMLRASQYQEKEECDWDEKTQTLTDNDMIENELWKLVVPDGVRYALDQGKLGEKGQDLMTEAVEYSGYEEFEYKWESPDGADVEMSIRRQSGKNRIKLFKHKKQHSYFSIGESVHYLRLEALSVPEVTKQAMIGRPAQIFIDHPFVGPGDIIKSIKFGRGGIKKVIINLNGPRQLAERPPMTDREKCLEEIKKWNDRGYTI